MLPQRLNILLGISLLGASGVSAFSLQPAGRTCSTTTTTASRPSRALHQMDPFLYSATDESAADEAAAQVPEKMYDPNGLEFTEGALVRVCKPGLKAFQVSPKGRGSFDDTKAFQPDPSSPYLVIPVGLRGTVQKIYDTEIISANLPIQVKFQPDLATEEGYSSPVSLLMHFLPEEIEMVV